MGLDVTQTPLDGELMVKAIGGDRRAYDQLVHRYQRQAVAVAYRLLGNSHDAARGKRRMRF